MSWVEHLRKNVSDKPCMHCSFLPHTLRLARLAEVEHSLGLVSEGTTCHASKSGRPSKNSCKVDCSTHKVNALN